MVLVGGTACTGWVCASWVLVVCSRVLLVCWGVPPVIGCASGEVRRGVRVTGSEYQKRKEVSDGPGEQ